MDGVSGKADSDGKKAIEKFLAGKDVLLDQGLVKWEVLCTAAHQIMLNKIGVLTDAELGKIMKELVAFYENGLVLKEEFEDVHGNLEAALIAKLGDLGKKVHTATSRNEKVMTDIKLYAKDGLLSLQELALGLASALAALAEKHANTQMPGYTHHQQAMPYTFGSFLMSHFYALMDDVELMKLAYAAIDNCPMGAGAGYGIPIGLDKDAVKDMLGFASVHENSLNAISSRGKDEAIVAYACHQLMADMAKLAEDLILFSTKEFGFVELPDEYCTGSSIMPQKKNPDFLELVKGKSAQAAANLVQILMTSKNLPSGYNRDTQETKGALMDSMALAAECLSLFPGLVAGIKADEAKMKAAMGNDLFATHHGLSMVEDGVPYKEAYKLVGEKIRNGGKLPEVAAKPDFGGDYKKLLHEKKAELEKAKAAFDGSTESLISLAKKISNNKN